MCIGVLSKVTICMNACDIPMIVHVHRALSGTYVYYLAHVRCSLIDVFSYTHRSTCIIPGMLLIFEHNTVHCV